MQMEIAIIKLFDNFVCLHIYLLNVSNKADQMVTDKTLVLTRKLIDTKKNSFFFFTLNYIDYDFFKTEN